MGSKCTSASCSGSSLSSPSAPSPLDVLNIEAPAPCQANDLALPFSRKKDEARLLLIYVYA